MYSGTTLTKASGRIVGTHQKFDRLARKHLSIMIGRNTPFPRIKTILQFEGKNGPDAIKRKSPAQDEPWHYFDPFSADDNGLIELINQHHSQLVKSLIAADNEKAAFEAAWLAHAIVDGLTPAHHYPYEEKLVELRQGKGIEHRTTFREKLVMPGENARHKVKNNWHMWGPKGLFTSHMFFEWGVASIVAPLTFSESIPTIKQRREAIDLGLTETFVNAAREIAVLDMYEVYQQKGWTPKLAWQVRHKLGPIIVKTLTLAWYLASVEAGLTERP